MATLKGRVILGWMPRDEAIRFLLDDCVFDPAIDATAAGNLWQDYRNRVDVLPVRTYALPTTHGLTPAEAGHANLAGGSVSV